MNDDITSDESFTKLKELCGVKQLLLLQLENVMNATSDKKIKTAIKKNWINIEKKKIKSLYQSANDKTNAKNARKWQTKEEIDQFVIDATQNQTCMETRMLNYKFVH